LGNNIDVDKSVRSIADGLEDSLRRVATTLLLVWQPVMAGAILGTLGEIESNPWTLLALHLATVVALLLGLRSPRVIPAVVLALYALAVVDLTSITSIESPLGLATIWMLNLTNLVLPMATRRRICVVLALAATVCTGAAVFIFARGDIAPLGPSITFTGVVTVFAVRVGVQRVRQLGRTADQAEHDLAVEREAILVEQSISRSSAEDARVLHDTVVNTLSLIAVGGAATSDLESLRTRCREDVERVSSRFMGRVDSSETSLLAAIRDRDGVRLSGIGLSGEEMLRVESLLDRESVQALIGAIGELTRNVAKHAGVTKAQLHIEVLDSRVVLTFADGGKGFDGDVIAGRGLAESVVARIRDVGGDTRIESSPGAGTTVQLTLPIRHRQLADVATQMANPPTNESAIESLRWQGIQIWTLGILAVGVLLELFNQRMEFSFTYVMLVIVALGVGFGMLIARQTKHSFNWLLAPLAVTIPAGYVAGLAGVGFGADHMQYYQAIAMSPLLLVPLLFERKLWFIMGIVVYSLSAGSVVSIVALSEGKTLGLGILILSIPVLLVAAIASWWNEFLTETVTILEGNRSELLKIRAKITSREQMAQARQRWWAAGLTAALQTLTRIGDGSDDPRSPEIQQRCLAEEQYLRQLTLMSTQLSRLSPWIVNAMVEAQKRMVSLVLRIGDADDAPDPATAEMLGGLILQRVADTDAGETANVSVFAQGEKSSLLLVGQPWKPNPLELPAGWSALHQDLGEHHLFEVSWPAV
jgi:signal transduction histidine kinase